MMLLASALLMASLGDFKLQSGQVIQDCKIAYRTHGRLNEARSNAILFPTWFNGTTADLEKYVGAQGLVDDSKYYVVLIDTLSNGVSSSPSNSTTQHGKAFPAITTRDMVESEHALAEKLGITHAFAVMGISLGGMQTFQWLTAYPNFMDRAVTIVGTPKMTEKDIILWTSFLNGLHLKKQDGSAGEGTGTKGALLDQVLRAAGPLLQSVLQPQARQQLAQIFAGGNQPGNTTAPEPDATGNAAAPIGLPINSNPEDVLHQFGAITTHDITRQFGESLTQTAAAIRAKALVINSVQDKAVSPGLPQEFADMIHAEKFMMTGPCGHNAYKPDCEERKISPVVLKFLGQ